mmetsp:Transcript_22853/g.51688  ORF Transcript_22853/g.51688 Transcript_22853/m.51688 type:complete len:211 (-) Transcript_22853:379-1011(-)
MMERARVLERVASQGYTLWPLWCSPLSRYRPKYACFTCTARPLSRFSSALCSCVMLNVEPFSLGRAFMRRRKASGWSSWEWKERYLPVLKCRKCTFSCLKRTGPPLTIFLDSSTHRESESASVVGLNTTSPFSNTNSSMDETLSWSLSLSSSSSLSPSSWSLSLVFLLSMNLLEPLLKPLWDPFAFNKKASLLLSDIKRKRLLSDQTGSN